MRARAPLLLLVVLAVAIAGTTLHGLNTSTPSYSVFNPRWDGASSLQDEAEAVGAEPSLLLQPTDYGRLPADGTVAVVLSPDEAYTATEAAGVRAFVERGGTLVVAEDFGPHANPLLSAVGASARIDGRPLRDKRSNAGNQSLPTASNVTAHPYTDGVTRLTFNHGTALHPDGATTLVTSAGTAYLDSNRNEVVDAGESLGARPLVAVEPVGAGTVVVVGDPSLFINAMLDRPDNRAFARALFAAHDRVALDYSHAAPAPPLAYLVTTVRETPWAQAAVGAAALAAAVAGARLARRRIASDPPDDDRVDRAAVAAHLRRAHPDWEPERVERVLAAVERRRDARGDGSFRPRR